MNDKKELDIQEITDRMMEYRKNNPIKRNTIKIYLDRVLLLHKIHNESLKKKKSIINYLNSAKTVIKNIKEKYDDLSSINTVLYSFIAVAEALHCKEKSIKVYRDEFEKLREIFNNKETHIKTNEEDENWMTIEEINGIVERLKESIESTEMGPELFRTYQNYMLISLYTLMPPVRNDFIDTRVLSVEPENLDLDLNYIILSTKEMVMNRYKTSRTYGTNRIQIPDELISIIKNYFVIRNEVYPELIEVDTLLLNFSDISPMKRRNVSKYLHKILGKKVSVSMLRKIYISTKYPVLKTRKEMITDAKTMGHSVSTQQNLYRKK